MVEEFARYVKDNPSDPTHLLEIHDLANFEVNLSFISDQEHIVFIAGSDSREAAGPTIGTPR